MDHLNRMNQNLEQKLFVDDKANFVGGNHRVENISGYFLTNKNFLR